MAFRINPFKKDQDSEERIRSEEQYEDIEEENTEYESESDEEIKDEANTLEVRVVRPKKYDEAPQIADYLLNGKVVFLNLESTDKVNSTRILDYLMGAIYILKGDLQPVSSTAFMIGPSGVDITGEIPSDTSAKSNANTNTTASNGFSNL